MEHSVTSLQIIPSGGGVFEVTVDDALLYSKKSLGRHAKAGEMMEIIRNSKVP